MNGQRKKYYQIKWKESAIKLIRGFPKDVKQRVVDTVERLGEDPFKGEPLAGELKGLRRVRIGDYRIVYLVDTEKGIIIIVKAGKRGNIYK